MAALLKQISPTRRFGERVLKGVRVLKSLREFTRRPTGGEKWWKGK